MSLFKNTRISRSIVFTISFIIVSLILWNTYDFFQKFKQEERLKMEIIASAQKNLATNTDLNADIELPNKIITGNNSIPMILVNQMGKIESWQNLDSIKAQDSIYLKKQLSLMKNENNPVVINFYKNKVSYIYYRNSDLLNKLRYYPLALILILVLFASVIYMVVKSNKIADQNKLWTGMAKETAHQIGTPLSSLMGWIEILKIENTEESTVKEIEKDVERLNVIAQRFSKIGSVPELEKQNIVAATEVSFNYLKSRSSKKINFHFAATKNNLHANINIQLFSWVIENLIKNAIDAMQGIGDLQLDISHSEKFVQVIVSDSGKGIPKNLYTKIFTPGFTTKKRGWGLGLSLSKRIIEDYHQGKIFVKKSEIKKGTSIAVQLNKV